MSSKNETVLRDATAFLQGRVIESLFQERPFELGFRFTDGARFVIERTETGLDFFAEAPSVSPIPGDHSFTALQGQYLAFIHNYSVVHGVSPAEADSQRFFRVTPAVVHQQILALAKKGLLSRQARQARSLRVLVSPTSLPSLEPVRR